MPETKLFHLGDVLSISDGRLVSPRLMEGVYDILNWMTDDNLSTIGLLAVHEVCKARLLEEFPSLANVDRKTELTADNWRDWLASQVEQFGEWFHVPRLSTPTHRTLEDDLETVSDIRGGDMSGVIVVQP